MRLFNNLFEKLKSIFSAEKAVEYTGYVSRNRIRSINRLILSSVLCLLQASIFDAWFGYTLPAMLTLITAVLFAGGYLLNSYRFNERRNRLIMLTSNLFLFVYASFFGYGSGLNLYYLLIIIATSSLLRYNKRYQQLIYLGMPALCFIAGELTNYELFLIEGLPQTFISLKYKFSVFGVFILVQLFVSFIVNSYNKHKDLLKRSEKKSRTILENNDNLTFLINEAYEVLDFNALFKRNFRRIFKTDVVMGEDILSFFSINQVKKDWKVRFDKAFAGEVCSYIDTFKYGGQKYTYETKMFPVGRYPDIERVTVMMNDITAHKNTEEKLKRSQKFLQFVIDNIPEGVFWKNKKLVYTGCNHQFANLLGYDSVYDIIGKTDFELLENKEDAQHFNDIDRHVMEHKTPFRMVHRSHVQGINQQDEFMFIETNKVILSDENKTIGVLGTIKDVTAIKKKEEELREQNEALRKLNNELDSLIYRVSHDLRAPIASALGLINVARLENEAEQISHYLDLQERSLNKLDRFIGDILIYSRNNREKLKLEELGLQSLIEQVYSQLSYGTEVSNLTFKIKVDLQVPFYSDRSRIEVIFNNLISNAIRYSAPEKDRPYLNVWIKGDDQQVKIVVEDNGQGIGKEHIDKVFDMFYRANDRIEGTGIGLYIVKDTVRMLNGTIEVCSEYKQGTAFILTLPNSCPMVELECEKVKV